MGGRSLALLGAAGGVGSTRLSVEAGAALAADGHDAIVLDASLATQGMAAYVPGRIDPDITTVLIDDADLEDAVIDHPAETPGRFGLCPSHAPFVRLAEVQSPEAAKRLEDVVTVAENLVEYVIVDVPPIASNVAVAGATAPNALGVVTTPTDRGRDALSRCRGRIADIGASADFIVGNRVGETEFADADVRIPSSHTTDIPQTPTVLAGDDGFGPGVAMLVESGLDLELSVSLETGLLDTAREYLSSGS